MNAVRAAIPTGRRARYFGIMTELRTMPRPTITLAALIIIGCAVAGLALGLTSKLKSPGGGDPDNGDVVAPIKTVANATPLTAPPVTEADVRRWAREELAAARAAAPKKAKADDPGRVAGEDAPATPGSPPQIAQPAAPATPGPKPQVAQQIPF